MGTARWRESFFSYLGLFILLSFHFRVMASSGITYQGRLLDPSGVPVTSSNVQFKLQIRTPGAEDCLMYEEIQTMDLSLTKGVFAISLGDGSGTRTDTHVWSLFDSLSNRTSFSFAGGECNGSPSSFTPSSNDNRKFKVFFDLGSGWESLPVQTINYIPMSIETYAVGGFPASSLFRVEDAGVLGNVSALTTTQYNNLVSLANGSSSVYEKSGELNGSALPSLTSGQTLLSDGSGGWTAGVPVDTSVESFARSALPICTAGEVLFTDGSSLSCVTDTSGGSLLESDIPTLTSSGNGVDGGAISGTIGGSTVINTSGDITTTGNLSVTGSATTGSFSTRQFDLYDSDNSNKISFLAPATGDLTSDYTLTLPATAGTSGQVLSTDGSGTLSWINAATGSVTGVSGTSPIQVSGTTSVTISVDDATTSAKGVVQLAASTDTTAGLVVQANDTRLTDSRNPDGTAGGDLSGNYPNPTVSKIQGISVSATDPTLSGQVLRYDGSAEYTPSFIDISDIRSNIGVGGGVATFPTSCTASQTLTWSALTNVFSCSDISIEMDQISDLSAQWTATGADIYYDDGNVGIGTTAPYYLLQVTSTVGSASLGIVRADNSSQAAKMEFMPAGANSPSNVAWAWGMPTGNNNMQLDTWNGSSATNILTVKNSGNVGIGTTTPSSELAVASTQVGNTRGITSLNVSSGGAGGQFLGLSSRGSLLNPTFPTEGDSLATFSAGGRDGTDDYRSGYFVFLANSDHSASNYETYALLRMADAGDTTPKTVMSWMPSGKVGIGTEEPTVALDVVGTIKATGFEGPLTSTSTSLGDGTASAPSMTFTSDPDTGFYSSGTDSIGISAGGNKVWDITDSGIVSPTAGGASISSGDGTAAAPTFSFSGDTDTGWYLAAADTLAASTGGTERMSIDSSGNVSVNGRLETKGGMLFSQGSGPMDNLIYLQSTSSGGVDGGLGFFAAGVGSGSANDGPYFLARGNLYSASAQRGSMYFVAGAPASPAAGEGSINFWTGYEEPRMTIANNGYVAIGTSTPLGKLSIIDDGYDGTSDILTATSLPGISLLNGSDYVGLTSLDRDGDMSTTTDDRDGMIYWGDNTDDSLRFASVTSNKATTRMIITGDGRVGIGTSSPNASLDVLGTENNVWGLALQQNNATASNGLLITTQTTTATDKALLVRSNGGTNSILTVRNDGNVGIGTTNPASTFHVVSSGVSRLERTDASSTGVLTSIYATRTNSSGAGADNIGTGINFLVETETEGVVESPGYISAIATDATSGSVDGKILFHTSKDGVQSAKMSINQDGFVGIGTTAPSEKLEIVSPGLSNAFKMGSSTAALRIINYSDGANWIQSGSDFTTGSSADLKFSTMNGASVKMIIKSDGNVGIGTVSPTEKLHVAGSALFKSGNVQTSISLESTTGTKAWFGPSSNGGLASGITNGDTVVRAQGQSLHLASDGVLMTLTASGNVGIGTTNPGYKLHVNGSVAGVGAYQNLSDRRLKADIRPIENPIEKIMNLQGVRFNWKQDEYPQYHFDRKEDIGVIAQEVEKVLPEAVTTGSDGIKTVAYAKLVAPLIEAFKALQTKVQRLEVENSRLKEENVAIKAWICSKDPQAEICR